MSDCPEGYEKLELGAWEIKPGDIIDEYGYWGVLWTVYRKLPEPLVEFYLNGPMTSPCFSMQFDDSWRGKKFREVRE